jgi:hypothetical protein
MSRFITGKVILYLFILIILDVALMPVFGIFRPSLTYLWVLYAAFHAPWSVLPAAVIAGIGRDLVGSQPLGIETAVLVTMSIGLNFAMQKLEHGFLPMRFIVATAFIFLGMMLNLAFSGFLFAAPQLSWYAVFSCFMSAVTSAAVMPVFFYFTSKWFPVEGRMLKQYELFG